ncbi:PQQ-binding-like beta-propeller repeat protein [Planctomicrobium sp. SH668]|uniref:beta-propeller domain-containing protein n=1 Tax=Planctomicrobium sp. SH668 TaxID=3448126 RepID=UPI003F5C72EC
MSGWGNRILIAMAAIAFCGSSLLAAEVSSSRHAVIAADKGRISRFNEEGKLIWSYDLKSSIHHFELLSNGNLLTQQHYSKLIEIHPSGRIVWTYDSSTANGNEGKQLEVHTFQRLENGHTMIVENGVGRIIEIDADGKLVKSIDYQVSKPNAHSDVRRAHQLDNGNYLVCHEADGRVVEYSGDGGIVWSFDVPLFGKERRGGHGPEAFGNQVYNALRLKNGNTLIATGNGHSVIEVTPAKEIVWELHQNDLPGITLAWVTSLEVLENGNLIIGNCHAGPDQPQLIEVSRDKTVLWTFKDHQTLGNDTAASATVTTGTLR